MHSLTDFGDKMYTIGQIAKQFKISRSTLLYYDKIGLLTASSRTLANYRVYIEKDFQRMAQIDTYKKAGVPLKEIGRIIDSSDNIMIPALEKRLGELNKEINTLRKQQRKITSMLSKSSRAKKIKTLDKKSWIKILKASGMDEMGLTKWHIEFENTSPEAHQEFLESLGMDQKEIKAIRDVSSTGNLY